MRLFNATCLGFLLLVGWASTGSNDVPFATKVVSMQYPRIAAMAQITGAAVLRVRIDGTGAVLSAEGLSGHPILIKAAAANMKLWRFSTGQSGGEKTGSVFDFTYVFELKGASFATAQCSELTYEYPSKVTIVSKAPYVTP